MSDVSFNLLRVSTKQTYDEGIAIRKHIISQKNVAEHVKDRAYRQVLKMSNTIIEPIVKKEREHVRRKHWRGRTSGGVWTFDYKLSKPSKAGLDSKKEIAAYCDLNLELFSDFSRSFGDSDQSSNGLFFMNSGWNASKHAYGEWGANRTISEGGFWGGKMRRTIPSRISYGGDQFIEHIQDQIRSHPELTFTKRDEMDNNRTVKYSILGSWFKN